MLNDASKYMLEAVALAENAWGMTSQIGERRVGKECRL